MGNKKLNILHLTPDFNYTDGRSYYVYLILKYLKRDGHNVFLCTNGGDSLDRIKDLGIPAFIHSSLSNKSSFLNSLKYISYLFDTNTIDIIHSYHRYYELMANSVNKKKNPCTVFTALSIVDKRFFVEYKSDRIIAVSNCVKDMLIKKFNINKNKISLIPNFVDSEEVSGNRESSIANRQSSIVNRESSIVNRESEIVNRQSEIVNRESSIVNSELEIVNRQSSIVNSELEKNINITYILAVGRFHKEKNFETLFKAIALLHNYKEYKIKLILVGEGEEKNKYEIFFKENSLDVELISPQRNLNQFFNIADMCVLTSLRDPLPGFMLQSGLHNKPFIGSNVDGIAEVIKNRENGLLFERKNEFQLSEMIKLFINDKLLAKKCADNLSKLIYKKYTEKSVVPEIEKLYYELLV